MKKVHIWPALAATTVTTGLIYTVCTLLFVLLPTKALNFFRNWFHGIDLAKITGGTTISLSSFFVGLVEIIVFTAIFTLIFVWTYNSCVDHCKKRGWIKEE